MKLNQLRIQNYQFCIRLDSSKSASTKAFKAFLFALFLVFTNQPNAIAGTTTADFLKWEKKAQVSFLQVSISMAAVIASQAKPKIARCLNDWYYKTKALQIQRQNEILHMMPKYKKYDPTAVLLGYIEGACGKFTN